MSKKYHIILILLFIIPIVTFSLISIFDVDKIISEDENRMLNQMPEFDFKYYFTGKFSVDFENYYADTFPSRSIFMSISRAISELKGFDTADGVELVITDGTGDLGTGESDIPVFEPDETIIPDPEPSLSSTPSASPSTSPSTTGSTENPVHTTPDPTTAAPTTEAPTAPPATIPPDDVETLTNIIIYGDRAMELFYYKTSRLQYYINTVNKLQSKLGSKCTVYSLITPTSIEFYSPEKFHSLSQSQKDAISYVYSKLTNVKTVDAYSEISKHTNEYLYFRTDHHWTARGAYYAYRAFAKSAGFEPVPLSQYETKKITDFVGSFYRSSQKEKLRNNPDYVELFMPFTSYKGEIFKDETMVNPVPIQAVRTKVSSSNKYLAFIGGDSPLVFFKTEVKNGKKILITKESFGNAFVPFLLPHYEEIYVVDPRQIQMDLCKFINDKGIQEVIVLDYTVAVGNSKFVEKIDHMIY